MSLGIEDTLAEIGSGDAAPISEMWINPDDWVAHGHVLPPNRPDVPACVHVVDGKAEWLIIR
jgi:hypothetical protein